MKCLLLFFLNLSILLSNVYSLGITVQSNTIVGTPTLIVWNREASDPDNLTFDLRFVQNGFTDVGLAVANISPKLSENLGQLSVVFPKAGKYVLYAVTGSPQAVQIGRSNEVAAVQVATSTTASSSTTPTATSITTSSTPTSAQPSNPPAQTSCVCAPARASSRNVNLPAIVGGIVGGLLLMGLLATAFVYIHRRRDAFVKRISFHKDLMVQQRTPTPGVSILTSEAEGGVITPYPFSASINPPRRPTVMIRPASDDVERGLSPQTPASSTTPYINRTLRSAPLGTGHIVPSPRGPRPSIKRERTTVKFPASPAVTNSDEDAPSRKSVALTPRQQELVDRSDQLRAQMNELIDEPNPGSNTLAVLDNMQKQMSWLVSQKDSAWALGQTDVLPPGYARHMTP